MLGGGKQVHATTFHDYCLDLLKREHKDFGVLDEKDLWIYLRRRIRELHLEHYVRAANVAQFLNDLLEFVGRCHDELVTPEKYAHYVERLERGEVPMQRVAKSKNALDDAEILGRCREIARVFTTMEGWLLEENLGSFSHMITRAHALLDTDESILAEARIPRSLYPGRRVSRREFRADQDSRPPRRSRWKSFRRRGSRPGDLSFSRSVQRGVRTVSSQLPRRQAGGPAEEPAIDHSDPAKRVSL